MNKRNWLILAALAAVAIAFTLLSPVKSPVEEAPPPMPAAEAPASSSSPAASPAPTTTNQDPAAFQNKLDEISAGLPRVSELRALPEEEVHHTPNALLEAGEKMGEVAEALDANPALLPQAVAFYRDCAKGLETATSVRALCYYHWNRLTKGSAEEPQAGDVPAEIRDLANKL